MKYKYYICEDLSLQDDLYQSIDTENPYTLEELSDLGLYFITEIPDEDFQNDSTDSFKSRKILKYQTIDELLKTFIFNNLDIFQMDSVLDRLYALLLDGAYYILEIQEDKRFKILDDDIILDHYTLMIDKMSNDSITDNDKKTISNLINNIKKTFGNNRIGFVLFRFNDGEIDIRDIERFNNEIRLKGEENSTSFENLIQHLFYHSPVVLTTRIFTPDKIDGYNFQELYSYIIGIKKDSDSEFICVNIKADDIMNSYEVTKEMKYEIYCDLSGKKIMGYDFL